MLALGTAPGNRIVQGEALKARFRSVPAPNPTYRLEKSISSQGSNEMMAKVNRAFSANLSLGCHETWGVAPGCYECRAFGAKHK